MRCGRKTLGCPLSAQKQKPLGEPRRTEWLTGWLYVSPLTYDAYDRQQITAEAMRVRNRAADRAALNGNERRF